MAHVKLSDAGVATAYTIRECVSDKSIGGGTQNIGTQLLNPIAL